MPRKPQPAPVKEVAKRFRVAREHLRITQEELANEVGTSQHQISKFEGGTRGFETPTLVALLQAARRRGASVDFILTGNGPIVAATDNAELSAWLRALLKRESLDGDTTDEPPGPGKGRK